MFAAPSCLNTSIDNLVMKPRTRWKTDKSDTNFQKRPDKLGRTNLKRLRGKSDPEQFRWNIARVSLGMFPVSSRALPHSISFTLSHSFRIELRTGNNANRNQKTNIAPRFSVCRQIFYVPLSFLSVFVIPAFFFFFLFRRKFQESYRSKERNLTSIFLLHSWNF